MPMCKTVLYSFKRFWMRLALRSYPNEFVSISKVVTIELSTSPPTTYVLDGTLLTVKEGSSKYNIDVSDSTNQNPIAINSKGKLS